MTDTKKQTDPRIIAFVVILIAVGGAIAYFGFGTSPTASGPAPAGAPASLTSAELATTLEKLKALVPIPEDEVPQTIVIEDSERAKVSQPFLENAENGDILLLFVEGKIAVLYRSSTNAIIALGPLNDGPPPADAGAPTP